MTTNMIPARISHVEAPPFRREVARNAMENQSTHPCHRLSIPAARLFWCRHCMQIFEDPITRWRHSKTCLQSSSGKVRKDKDGSTMQVFLSANNVSELRREHNRSRVISRSSGPGHSPGTDLRCFICKMPFVSIDEMRVHVRNPCRKRPTLAGPKHKFSTLPAEVKTEIQIPDSASEIIYIKDGHQTVISLEDPCTADILKSEFIEPSQEYQPGNFSGAGDMFIIPDTFDSTTNLNAIEQTVEISAVETIVPFTIKTEEVPKQPKNRTENKENNIRKRKRILPKEVDDWPNHKTSNPQKSEQQIAMGLPIKSEDVKDVLDDFESPPIKISKMTNKDPEDETSETKVRALPLQIKEELSQLLTAERKDNQLFLGVGEHIPNGVVTEQVSDEDVLLKAPVSPVERIVTGDAAEAKLKDLFTTMEMLNKTKSSPSSKQTKTVSSPRKSKTSSPMKIGPNYINKLQMSNLEKDEKQLSVSQEETIDTSGLLLYMPPINAGSVTLPDPLLDLRNGLPAEMLLDETTNMKSHIPFAWEAFNVFVPSDIMEETKLPSHIFDGDLLPSQIHSEVLFEEIIDEKEHPPLVDNRLEEELVSTEINFEDVVTIESPVDITKVKEDIEVPPVAKVDPPTPKLLEENQEITHGESELVQVKEKFVLQIPGSLKMSNQTVEEAVPAEDNVETKTTDEPSEEEEASVVEKPKSETKHKSTKLFKCKACSNTFKTPQALQKHSRFPCILKHTRSLSQKILRPKQPCLKIEKKPLKKKMVKPSRRPKLMIPIMPITRPELIRPAVPRRPKRFSRRKKRRSFFIDEQNRILPYVNVLMSELSDKDRFFYKLGMLNQCRKIHSFETTTTTAPNAEAPAVATSGDSAERAPSTLEFPVIVTESTYPPEIGPLSVVAESQGIAYSASPAVAAACVSDKENLSAMAKGLCLTLPTLEKMEDHQFHDPNCISPSHVKPVPDDDPPRDPSGVTGQSVQSPCWEAAPRLAQLPGVTQIVRVTSAKPSSAGLLNGIDTTNESFVAPESDQSNVLANTKGLSLFNSSLHCKTQSKIISKETVNDPNLNISGELAVKNPAFKCDKLNLKEPLGNVFENCSSQPETTLVSLQELSIKEEPCVDTIQKDSRNLADNNLIQKIQPNSVSKVKIEMTKDVETDLSSSSVNKNSTESNLNYSQTAKYDVIKSVNLTKNHNRTNDRNQNQTDSCADSDMEKKKHRSVDFSISNSQKIISSSLSKNVTCLSSKEVTANRNSDEPASSCKEVAKSQESPMTIPTCNEVAPSQRSPMTTSNSGKKVYSNQESTMPINTLCKKVSSNQETPMGTTTLSKNLPLSSESPIATTSLGKTVTSNLESPMATITLEKKVAPSQESPRTTTTSCQKEPSSQESPMATTTLSKKVAPNTESRLVNPTHRKILASSWNSMSTFPTSASSSEKVIPNQHSTTSSKTTELNAQTNMFSVKIENPSESGLSNEQTRTSPVSTLPAIISPVSSTSVCGTSSDSVDDQARPDSTSVADQAGPGSTSVADQARPGSTSVTDQARPDPQGRHQSETRTHQIQSGTPVIKRENNLELQPLQDKIAQPYLKSLHVDVAEKMPKSSSDTNNEHERHFSDIFGHEKDSLKGEDLNVNYQISPSKERSKRHFTDFLCGFSEEAQAVNTEQGHSDSSLGKIKSIKIEETNDSEYLKTNEALATSTRDSEVSQMSSGIGCSNILQVAEIPAVSCGEQEKQEFGNEQSVKMTESADKSVLAKEKLKGDQKPSPRSGECYSESPSTELLSRESLLKSGSSDPLKTEATTVVNVINKAVATTLSCGVDNGEVTNSSPVEYKTPLQKSKTPSNVSTLNHRISIATQTDSSFLKEIKIGQSVPSDSCDNVEKNEPPPPSVSINPDPTPPLPSSPTTNTTTNTPPVDNIPPPIDLSEEVVQENLHLDPNVLPSLQEIVINDTPLSPVSLSPPGATCEVVQGDSGLQEDNTDASNVLLQQSVPDPLGAVATESSPLMQQLVLDNTTDPNVLVQYLNSLDPSLLPQEVTFVIIQGTPGEPLHLTDDHNFIIEQAAFSEQTEQESDSHSVIYTMQPPHSDITTEAECIITDSS